jgi:hypothetical protein
MEWSPAERPTILKVGTPCWQLLLPRDRHLLLEPPADEPNGGLQTSRPVASASRRLAHFWWSTAAVRLGLVACRQQCQCGRVRAAWVLGLCVQSSVMSALLEIRIGNYQFTTSECAEPTVIPVFRFYEREWLCTLATRGCRSFHSRVLVSPSSMVVSLERLRPPCAELTFQPAPQQLQDVPRGIDVSVPQGCLASAARDEDTSDEDTRGEDARVK